MGMEWDHTWEHSWDGGDWTRDALGIELGVHQENVGDATGMQQGWNGDEWNATEMPCR